MSPKSPEAGLRSDSQEGYVKQREANDDDLASVGIKTNGTGEGSSNGHAAVSALASSLQGDISYGLESEEDERIFEELVSMQLKVRATFRLLKCITYPEHVEDEDMDWMAGVVTRFGMSTPALLHYIDHLQQNGVVLSVAQQVLLKKIGERRARMEDFVRSFETVEIGVMAETIATID